MNQAIDLMHSPGPVEEGKPADDFRAFRRALGQFATGVTVIATSAGDEIVGMAANSFSTVSLEPPLVLWSIRKESKSLPAFLNNGHFSINVLGENQMEISGLFGRPQPDQFGQAKWNVGSHGDPLLEGAIAHFECVTESVIDGGDHHILVGRVERFARFDGAPLLFAQGQYGVPVAHPDAIPASASASVKDGQESEESLFLSLVKATDQHMSALFQEHRQELGVTVATGRILNRLSQGPCAADTLELETFLGESALEDALTELAQKGQVVQLPDGEWDLTDNGREVRGALRRSAEQFTIEQLRGIPATDLATAERVLGTLLGRGGTDR
ncbi:flavin reductase [Pseudarthrobacter sp. TAF60_1]|uniref:flavin reductase n=1 Tax=Pseudarthrobacter sp. TAF60_1 TaxID=3233071 RepID=UPI003F967867